MCTCKGHQRCYACQERDYHKQLQREINEFDQHFNSTKPLPLAEEVKQRGEVDRHARQQKLGYPPLKLIKGGKQ